MSHPSDTSPFYVSEHVVEGFERGCSGARISLSKKVKEYKVIFDSSENKYRLYVSPINRFINLLRRKIRRLNLLNLLYYNVAPFFSFNFGIL